MELKHIFMSPDQINEPSEETLNSFLDNFNSLKKKYAFEDTLDKRLIFPSAIVGKLTEYEESNRYGELVKQKYSSIIENLRLVYNDQNLIEKDVRTYHLVEENIVHKYLAIPQLDKLFDEDYFNFEWDMYVGQNLREHKSDYYRDHFIHEVRNLYMMDVLLEKFSFYEATKVVLSDPQKSKISSYVTKKAKQFLWDTASPTYKLLTDIKEDFEKTTLSFCMEEYAEQFFYRYTIYASAYLSALFHDLGYPICHFLSVRHRLSAYNPSLYMFTQNSVESFDQIAAKLNGSLLFTVVDLKEIKKRIECDEDGKYDHGVYSALAFLFQFYESGLIHRLTLEKQCAIELAALAIYNHTASYNCIKWDDNNHYNRPYFDLNPISFLLRVCDDLQEWDRRYFEITDDSDLLTCDKCKTPPLPTYKKVSDTAEVEFGNKKIEKFEYACACNTTKVFRHESFLKRKIYVVRTADTLTAKMIEESNVLLLSINYDLYRLLKMARVNSSYAKYRAKELNKTKRLLQYQNIRQQSNVSDCPNLIYLDYFISANPILIKTKILERYIGDKQINTWDAFLNAGDQKFIVREESEEIKKSEEIFKESYEFYSKLLSISKDCRCNGKVTQNCKRRLNNLLKKYNNWDDSYKKIITILIKDCLHQYAQEKSVDKAYSEFFNDPRYYEQYITNKEPSSLIYDCIDTYCCRMNDFNAYTTRQKINYYGDLYLFSWMNEKSLKNI